MNVIDRAQRIIVKEKLAVLKNRPKNSFTLKEYMEHTGMSPDGARLRLLKLIESNRARRVKFPQLDSLGRAVVRTGYQLV